MKPSEIFEGENSGLRKAFDEAVHIGGESKEEIEAEDGWHDEQITNTENTTKENQVFLDIFEILCRLDDSPRIDIHFQNKCYTAAQKISNILRANK